jgi:hypothetical protein
VRLAPSPGGDNFEEEDKAMSGVSITSGGGGGYDASAILTGGKEFLERLQQFTDAKNAADQAYERLGVGKNAAEQMDLAGRMVADAKGEAESIKNQAMQDAAARQKNLAEFIANARDAAAADRQAAAQMRAEADRVLAAANQYSADAAQKLADAEAKLADVTAKQQAFAAAAAVLSKAGQ